MRPVLTRGTDKAWYLRMTTAGDICRRGNRCLMLSDTVLQAQLDKKC